MRSARMGALMAPSFVDHAAKLIKGSPVICMMRYDETMMFGLVSDFNEEAVLYYEIDHDSDVLEQTRLTRWDMITEVIVNEYCFELYQMISDKNMLENLLAQRAEGVPDAEQIPDEGVVVDDEGNPVEPPDELQEGDPAGPLAA